MNIADNIDIEELIAEVPQLSAIKHQGLDWDTVGFGIDAQVQNRVRYGNKSMSWGEAKPRRFWPQVLAEMRLLVCTDDPKYTALRRKLKNHKGKATLLILNTITAYLAPIIGAPLASLVPLVGAVLYGIAIVGTNAWCGISVS